MRNRAKAMWTSPEGQIMKVQEKPDAFAYLHWDENGVLLDIGCGSGTLAVGAVKFIHILRNWKGTSCYGRSNHRIE